VGPTEYNLFLNVDTNTKGHQQWFYFKVKNTFKEKRYTFTIKNFTKPFSLHKHGMKVLMRSQKKRANLDHESDGWVSIKEEAIYQKTHIQRSGWRIPGAFNIDDEEDED
jgi:viroplasmin and RNaseH domain-containing protein